MKKIIKNLSLFLFLLSSATSCVQSTVKATAVILGQKAPSTSDGTANYIYIDVESKAQLGGIPYFVEGNCKVGVSPYSIYVAPGGHKYVDTRVSFAGIQPNTYGWIGVDRKFTGDTRYSATLAVNVSKGLPQGSFTGYINLNFPAIKKGEESQNHVYLGATWDPQIAGFLVQAWDTNTPVGQPLTLSNSNEIDLQIAREGGFVTFSARQTAYPLGTPNGWQELLTIADQSQSPDCSIEFGAEEMDPGDSLYFDYFYVGGPMVGGEAETEPMNKLNDAIGVCDTVQNLVNQFVPDLAGASEGIAPALTDLDQASQSLFIAVEEGTLQPNTRDKLAKAAIDRARKALLKAQKLCTAGNVKSKTSILKSIQSARDNCTVAIANLAGVKSTTRKKLPFKEQSE